MRRVRFLECAGHFRVVGTCFDDQKIFLLAGALDGLKRMTLGVRDCHLSGHSGSILAYHRRFCLQEHWRYKGS
jgi:hypothetical protein